MIEEVNNFKDFAIWVVKAVLKPGYLYGVDEEHNLYCIEAKIPKPGETIVMPPFYMPPKEDSHE